MIVTASLTYLSQSNYHMRADGQGNLCEQFLTTYMILNSLCR